MTTRGERRSARGVALAGACATIAEALAVAACGNAAPLPAASPATTSGATAGANDCARAEPGLEAVETIRSVLATAVREQNVRVRAAEEVWVGDAAGPAADELRALGAGSAPLAEDARALAILLDGMAHHPPGQAPLLHDQPIVLVRTIDHARTLCPRPRVPPVDTKASSVLLPTELVARIVHAHFPELRACYEAALARDGALHGTLRVRLVIDRDGTVARADDDGGDLADRGVVACVLERFAAMRFPPPRGGAVSIVYPMNFSPSD